MCKPVGIHLIHKIKSPFPFMLLNSQKKAAEGNLTLCPSARGQLHPYGLLDPT